MSDPLIAALAGPMCVPPHNRSGAGPTRVHQIYAWKKALTEAAPKVFAGDLGRSDEYSERKVAELYEQVGRLMVERDFLLRKSGVWNARKGTCPFLLFFTFRFPILLFNGVNHLRPLSPEVRLHERR